MCFGNTYCSFRLTELNLILKIFITLYACTLCGKMSYTISQLLCIGLDYLLIILAEQDSYEYYCTFWLISLTFLFK